MSEKIRVLIIGAKPADSDAFQDIIDPTGGLIFQTAGSGEEGLAVLKGFSPNVILLEKSLPDMDGYDVCCKIRSIPKSRFVRIIMIYDSPQPKDRLEGYKVGADNYLTRPFDAQEILAKIMGLFHATQIDEINKIQGRRLSADETLRKSEEKHRVLAKIGLSLTAEKKLENLLQIIVLEARNLSHADGGTLYLLNEDRDKLLFKILQNSSLKMNLDDNSESLAAFLPIPLCVNDKPNYSNVASYVAIKNKIVAIPDVYEAEGFDFTGPKKYDASTGYRSKSMLVVPIKDQENEVLGVLQLINSQDPNTGEIVSFDDDLVEVISSMASQAAIALINMKLVDNLRALLYSFVKSIGLAIDEKSPFTGGHIRRVFDLTMLIANSIDKSNSETFSNISFSPDEMEELRLAAWMHDIGKITVPQHIIDKETKLQTIFKRFDLIKTRFDLISQLIEIAFIEKEIQFGQNGALTGTARKNLQTEKNKLQQELTEHLEFIRTCDNGTEFLAGEKIDRLKAIAAKTYSINGKTYQYLTDNELANLCVKKGTLNDLERNLIERHTETTWTMLSQLPFPKNLEKIPEYACGHHERLDGSGYHKGLTAEQISIQVRIMSIADIFEALSAKDRPYREPLKLSKVFEIMNYMAKDNHIDRDILQFFIKEKIYLEYAEREMSPEQIDM